MIGMVRTLELIEVAWLILALEQKLAVYQAVTPKIFEALRGTAFVPSVMMGTAGSAGGTAMGLIDLLTAKTAKDLALDLTMTPGRR